MTHLERLDEHVDLGVARGVVEEQPAGAVERVELASRIPAPGRDERLELAAVAPADDQVDVAHLAVEGGIEAGSEPQPDPDATEQPDAQALLLGLHDELPAFVEQPLGPGHDRTHPVTN